MCSRRKENDEKIRTISHRSTIRGRERLFLSAHDDLYPKQNRFAHKSSYRERDNQVGGTTGRDVSKDGGFVELARPPRIGSSRLPFTAEVRATELDSGREIWGETVNLSKGGCYVRTHQPFSQGTLLVIEITNEGVRFRTDAKVAFALEPNGMGLSFVNIPANELPILEHWLAGVAGERPTGASRGAPD